MNMLDYIKNPDTWLSLAAIVVSVIALFQTAKQTKLSNKQHLFDRRLEKYVLIKDLLGLYKQNREYLVDKTELAEMVDLQFSWLVNCSYLTDMNQAMQTPLEEKAHVAFLTKCEQFERDAAEIQFIWNCKEAKLVSEFVIEYKELLHTLYKQQIAIKNIRSEKTMNRPISLEDFNEQTMKVANQIGLFDAIAKIDKTYREILDSNAEQILANSIKL